MITSNDYLARVIGAYDGAKMLEEKRGVSDASATLILHRIGPIQRFLDVAHCPRLSHDFFTHVLAQTCPNLLFLDISYTDCRDLRAIFRCCSQLRSLNIAGVRLESRSLAGVAALSALEILSLRSSNVRDVSAVEALAVLRSLDMGATDVNDVVPALRNKLRLEELLLDGCAHITCSDELLQALLSLGELRLFNVTESSLEAEWTTAFHQQCSRPLFVEKHCRRCLFFEAVINNDIEEVNRFLTSGQDVHARMQPNDAALLSAMYKKRCLHPKAQNLPFFLCQDASILAPNALHLAAFFHCLETAELLLSRGIDSDSMVHFLDVSLSSDGFLRATKPVTPDDKCSLPRMLDVMLERQVYRVVHGMIEQRVSNWRELSSAMRRKMVAVCGVGLLTNRRMSAKEVKLHRAFHVHVITEAAEAVDSQKTSKSSQAQTGANPLQSSLPALTAPNVDQQQNAEEAEKEAAAATEVTNEASLAANSGVPNAPVAQIMERLEEVPTSPVSPAPKFRGKRDPLPKRESLFPWRDHAMVAMLTRPPRVYQLQRLLTDVASDMHRGQRPQSSSITQSHSGTASNLLRSSSSHKRTKESAPSPSRAGKADADAKVAAKRSPFKLKGKGDAQPKYEMIEIKVMGKRSFWMESRRQALSAREKLTEDGQITEETDHSSIVSQESMDTIASIASELNGRTQRSRHPRPATMLEKREGFLLAVKERMEEKYMQRMRI